MQARWLLLPIVLGAGSLITYNKLFKPLQVQTGTVLRGTAVEAVYASGTIEAQDRVEVKARIAGPIIELTVREGDLVKEDQLLARIDAPTLGLDVSRGRVELAAAQERASAAPQIAALAGQEASLRAQLAQAKADQARAEKLLASGAGVPLEVERARTQVASLEAQIASSRAQQQDAKIALRTDALRQKAGVLSLRARARDADVRSPMEGVILKRRIEKGEVVGINQNLLRIGDLRHLWIESHVDEGDIGRVREKMPAAVRLYAFEGKVFPGHVARVLPDADRDRKSFEVDIELDDKIVGLLPGMTAEINILIRQHDGVLMAPTDALHGDHVWTVGTDGRLHNRPVKTGIRDLVQVEILDGVQEGDVLVLEDEDLLKEGKRAKAVASKLASKPTNGGAPASSKPAG